MTDLQLGEHRSSSAVALGVAVMLVAINLRPAAACVGPVLHRIQAGEGLSNAGASALRDYAKQRIKELGLAGPGKVRINMAGCLDRCEEGPVIVVYPEEVWYTYVDKEDIDEIIDEHIQHGRVVDRLRI